MTAPCNAFTKECRWFTTNRSVAALLLLASAMGIRDSLAAAPATDSGDLTKVVLASSQAIPQITLEEFKAAMRTQGVFIIDARPEVFHRHEHIPGALALPRDEIEPYLEKLKLKLEKQRGERQPLLLVYCQNVSCDDARQVAIILIRSGLARVAVFSGGWDEWRRAKLPRERGLL